MFADLILEFAKLRSDKTISGKLISGKSIPMRGSSAGVDGGR